MKKLFNSKYFDAVVLTIASCLNILFGVIIYSIDLLPEWGEQSIWKTDTLAGADITLENFNIIFASAFFVSIALFALSILLIFLKNNKIAFFVSLPYNIILNFALLFTHVGLELLSAGAVACIIICIIISSAQLIYTVIRFVRNKEIAVGVQEEVPDENKVKNLKYCKPILLACQILTTVLALIVFFIPLYKVSYEYDETKTYALIDALSANFSDKSFPTELYISFIVLFIAFFASLIFFVTNIQYFFKSDSVFVKKSKQYVYCDVAFLLVYFILGFCLCFINNLSKSDDDWMKGSATTLSYIPLICSLVILVAFSVIQGKTGYGLDGEKTKTSKKFKLEVIIYITLLTLVTFLSLLLNLVEIKIEAGLYKDEVALTGYKLLDTYGKLGEGLQTLAFVLFAVLLVSGALFVFTLVSYFTKYKDFDKVVKTTAIINTVIVMLMGLSGVYFKIAQAINMENINSVLNYYGVSLPDEVTYTYSIKTKTIYMFIASFVILIVMLIRGQFNPEKLQAETVSADGTKDLPFTEHARPSAPADETAATEADFDACPAFTELDAKAGIFNGELAKRRANLFENLTLPNLVRFIVDYARECRLHLSYSVQDMATFVAGLGASRLTILQGMSGTGKTSLPKIFAEAIMGNCEIVEVESSWRDKNELLGYYNEFSKCFTPKKFTQCLYKAKLNSAVPTFIVLDEMNLSRIEYYFSDFLSLMEHEEDKREIKLLNVKLYRTENGEKQSYSALTDGHTIKIPSNVWFVGTANRDESTFEISDKVYDRAQTMNFNKRAPKIQAFGEPLMQKFVAYDMLTALFERAKSSFSFDAESNAIIQRVEKILTPYNISFGNRILRQMEDFVKIYCACFAGRDEVIKEAVEKILLSKVVCKLEYKIVENKEALAAEFDKLELSACSEFIRRLNED
ncbi:MAG: hypothetical protein K2G38_06170 [Clostridia bacterium]|nr:hypothetical protein [Clostridia bacterium]